MKSKTSKLYTIAPGDTNVSTNTDNAGANSQITVTNTTTSAHRRPQHSYQSAADETDLIVGDQQQARLLDSQEPSSGCELPRVDRKKTTTFSFAANMIGTNKNNTVNNNNNNNGHAGDLGSQQVGNKKKALTSSKNNNKRNILGDEVVDEDTEANQQSSLKESGTDTGRKVKCILITLMGLLLVLFLVVILLFSFSTLLDPEDEGSCSSENQSFQQPDYKLFSTKTLYTVALSCLSPPNLMPTPLNPQHNPQQPPIAASLVSSNFNQDDPNLLFQNDVNPIENIISSIKNLDRSAIYKPSIFSPNDSLESLNRRLTSPEVGCKAKQLHFYGRHAARLPSENELERLRTNLKTIQERIDLTSSSSQLSAAASTSTSTSTATTSDGQHPVAASLQPSVLDETKLSNGGNISKAAACSNRLTQFKQWSLFADLKHGNLVTETGAYESINIARRFKQIYPELFNHSQTNITLGVTPEIRTAQTAVHFLRQIDHFKAATLDLCNLNEFPQETANNRDQFLNNYCLKQLKDKHLEEKLSYHHKCKPYTNNEIIKQFENVTRPICKSISKKLKLINEQDELSLQETKSIYDFCRYETAVTGHESIWCSLFTEKELKLYEYLADVADFYNSAYGSTNQALSACAVTKSLLTSCKEFFQKTQNQIHLYFTHSEVIQRLIAASVNLANDPTYATDFVKSNLHQGQVPEHREWQTSLLTPFSANIAFTLYDCPRTKSQDQSDDGNSLSFSQTLNVDRPRQLKVVASLNEQPIRLDGCDEYACDFFQLYSESRLARDKKCNLDELCKPAPQF